VDGRHLSAGGRQARRCNRSDLGKAASDPGRCRSQPRIQLLHIANSKYRAMHSFRNERKEGNGDRVETCRGRRENSNMTVVELENRSRFIAATAFETDEIPP
jgi:hypothetical protein